MEKIAEKLIRYAKIDTMSDEHSSTYPSTAKQLNLAKVLKAELDKMHIESYIDEYGLVYAKLDGDDNKEKIGLIAHMDTSPSLQGGNFEPRIINNYDGKDIILNDTYTLSVNDFPSLKSKKGKTLIVTDGEHLLGGDDKAGISIIMSVLEYFVSHPEIKHHPIRVCFTPDEEIGAGADHFSTEKMDADFAYTIDGGSEEEISYENFNASAAHVEIEGVGIHPGDAKGKMVNAALLAIEFNNLLPSLQIPSLTEGYEGFIHLDHIEGDVEKASLDYIIRDHDYAKLKEKERQLELAAETIQNRYPHGKVSLTIKEQYLNMKKCFDKDFSPIDKLVKAHENVNVPYKFIAIRGGTDGARISYMGLPCPNVGTGDYACHGRYEHVVVEEMEDMCKVLINLLSL